MALVLKTVALSELRQMQLRASDIDEIAATSGLEPDVALTKAVEVSDWWYAVEAPGDGLIAVFGVAPSRLGGELKGVGCPWFLATDAFYKHKISASRLAKKWLTRMHQTYPVLFQFVDVRHSAALDWVAWLGFDVIHTQTYGRHGEQLIQVVSRRPFGQPDKTTQQGEHHV